ncbi:MAG: hypothetical protein ACFE9Z_01725 [Promethearchaeota archaeon]
MNYNNNFAIASSKVVSLLIILMMLMQIFGLATPILLELENPRLSQSKIFDGMYANYTFIGFITSYEEVSSSFKYTHYLDDLFNVTWIVDKISTSTWFENIQTRLTSNSTGSLRFGDGVHAPIWLFTNLSVNDLVLIAVDYHGDHIFNVTNEILYSHQVFGSLGIYVLEDMIYSQSIAWYEKNSGLLLNGTFMFPGAYYSLSLTATNMFSYSNGEDGQMLPIYILLTIIAITGICIFIIIRKKKPPSRLIDN